MIKEDLLETAVTFTETINSNKKAVAKSSHKVTQFECKADSEKINASSDISSSISVFHQLIEVEMVKCAKQLEMDKDQLQA